jgi:hypothetical protein
MTKCCKTLEYLESYDVNSKEFEELEEDLTALKCLNIAATNPAYKSIRNMLLKAGANMRTLKIQLYRDFSNREFEFSSLLEQELNITTLDIESDGLNIDEFLKKCPYIQTMTISGNCGKIKDVILKDLKKLTFEACNAACISNVLKHLSKTLVSVTLTCYFETLYTINELRKEEIPVLQKLDTLLITGYKHAIAPEAINYIPKFFPKNSQVTDIIYS